MDAKRQCTIDSFLAKRRRSEESIIECHGTIIISDEEIDFECDEDEQEVETAEANSGISVLSRFLTSGTSTATRVIERESGQSDSADSSGDDSYDTNLSSEDTEGTLSIKYKVPRVKILTLELIVAAIHCVVARVLMQISLFSRQLIILCLVRKGKGNAFDILDLHGIHHLIGFIIAPLDKRYFVFSVVKLVG